MYVQVAAASAVFGCCFFLFYLCYCVRYFLVAIGVTHQALRVALRRIDWLAAFFEFRRQLVILAGEFNEVKFAFRNTSNINNKSMYTVDNI